MYKDFELIVAMDMDGCIGKANSIPWHLPEDLKHFKALTENSIVIMGRHTFESLPNGPLQNRLNIVISSQTVPVQQQLQNYPNVIVTNMNDVFYFVDKYKSTYSKVFIIGGSQIYDLFITYCSKIHITNVNICNNNGDIFFNTKLLHNFKVINTSDIMTSKKGITYTFTTYDHYGF